MPANLDRFFRTLVTSFVVAALSLCLLLHYFHGSFAPKQRLHVGIPAHFINPAKGDWRGHQSFLAVRSPTETIPLLLLEQPELYASVFPGYEEARSDSELWRAYFDSVFGTEEWSSLLNRNGPSRTVMVSWVGNHKVYSRYGADVLIFGTSETNNGLVPEVFHECRRCSSSGNPKVLLLAKPAITVNEIIASAERLQKAGKKAKAAVWGYSSWNAFQGSSLMQKDSRSIEAELDGKYVPLEEKQNARDWFRWNLKDLKRGLSWDSLVPYSFQSIRNRRWFRDGWNFYSFHQPQAQDGFFISENVLANKAMLEKIAEQAEPQYFGFQGISERDCRSPETEKQLNEAIASLLNVSEKLFIYIAPTTPIQTKMAPPCFAPYVRELLFSRRSARVKVLVGDWKSYGLEWSDFAKNNGDGFVLVNGNHPNFKGAEKVSRVLLPWIEEELGKEHR